MIGGILLGVVGVGAILLGVKGFTEEGIPWSSSTNITGKKAKVIGITCIVFGIPVSLLALFMMVFQASR
ncbi:MAG: hypothetical protein AAGA29_14215 [Planctomycetota bacterium]